MGIAGNQINPNRHIYDKYPTPGLFTEVLLRHETFDGLILEPCAGEGHMSSILADEYPGQVICSDIHIYDLQLRGAPTPSERDIFSWEVNDGIDNIITNPPYGILNELMEHCMTIAHRKVALLLKLVSLAGMARGRFYAEYPPSRIIVISNNMKGSQFSHAWYIWNRRRPTILGQTKLSWGLAK